MVNFFFILILKSEYNIFIIFIIKCFYKDFLVRVGNYLVYNCLIYYKNFNYCRLMINILIE